MKKFVRLFVILFIVISLSSCGQKELPDTQQVPDSSSDLTEPEIQTDSAQVSSSQTPQAPTQEPSKKAFVFDMSVTDPMNGAPTYEQGVYKVLAVFEEAQDGYIGEVEITQKVLQSYDKTILNYQPDGYLINSFKSVYLDQPTREMPLEAKAALDELAANSKGQLFYGMLPTATREEVHFDGSTYYYEIPFDYTKINSGTFDISYLLSVEGNNAKLYLYFSDFVVIEVEGEMKNFSASKPLMAKTDTSFLYINEKGFSSEIEKLEDDWQVLFLGKNDGDSFNGYMYLSRIEQRFGSIPLMSSPTGDSNKYEAQIEFSFQPFDNIAYKNAGGQMSSLQTASLSHMSMANCQGNSVMLTAAGDTVYVELPGSSFQGIIEGKFIDSEGEIDRIFDESLDLFLAEFTYSISPKPEAYEGFDAAILEISEMIGNTEDVLWDGSDFMSELEGQCLWLPKGFIPMTSPIRCIEQNLLMAMNFRYLEESLWMDTLGPIYIQRFNGMRDFSAIEEFYIDDYTMEIVFRYGGKTIGIDLIEDKEGTDVDVRVYGQY